MDGHWEWSESSGDDGDTADLGGEPGGDYGGDYPLGHPDLGADLGGELGHDLGGEHDPLGGLGHHGGDDLEEPLGTEHAAEVYDQSVHDSAGYEDAVHDDVHDDVDDAAGQPELVHADADAGVDVDGYDGDGGHETFGADPDLHGDDAGWHEPVFPAELHLQDPPEPVDGFPWTDADVLGAGEQDHTAGYDPAGADGVPPPADLAAYDGVDVPAGGDPWALLLSSDDPATSSLAGFWAPHT